ncbi:hypothetical protein C482_03601 [Natrialba chahannaoensis JCM 10990]|uniref:DUF6760 domain-containing protein n=1 Tax=Natrialba chahannaoensis JCM 10990 TaxID=1227492 RepID=M0AZL8_9EURY|nr:hypothetical protein C482_03601 [Natrialba chahannaoensis JCM 10990]
MRLYDSDTLFEEVAFIAYHFGWTHDEILTLPHWERRRWCAAISDINDRINETGTPEHEQGHSATGSPSGISQQTGGANSFLDDDGDGIVLQNSLDER